MINSFFKEFKLSPAEIWTMVKKQRSKQVISLYTSLVLGLFASIISSAIVTRLLGPAAFGDLKFVQNICQFVVVFVTFGFFYSGSRLVASREHAHRKQQVIGAMVILGIGISLLFIMILFFGSWLENRIFHNNLGYIFRVFAPLLFIYPFEQFCENMLAGDNKIYNLSFFRLGPKIAYLLSCLGWHYGVSHLTVNSSFGLYLASMAIFILFAIFRLKPVFAESKENLRIVWNENKTYGFPVFIGALASVASAQLGGLSIGYFINNTNVGYFNLAITATLPLTLIPSTIGTTFFKEFANMSRMPFKVIYFTLVLSAVALIGFMLLIKPLVLLIYTRNYLPVVPLAYYTAVGSTLQGYGDFYNRFISAHGRGRDLRNASFAISFFNIIGYTFIVYFFGVTGAAITKIMAGLVYLAMMIYSYNNYVHLGKE